MKNKSDSVSLRRRNLLKGLGGCMALGATGKSFGMGLVPPEFQAGMMYRDFVESNSVAQNAAIAAKFQEPLPLLPEIAPTSSDATTDYFNIYQIESFAEMIPGFQTRVWTYNGTTPGPTFRVQKDREAQVRQYNMLPEQMSTHLHGGHIEAASDGHPTDLVQPNSFKDYTYSNIQQATTLWYHDHAVDETAPHVYKGMAGMYIIEDPAEASLNLPSGDQEVCLVIQDRSFNGDGSLAYAGSPNGEMGDTIIVNGKVQPHFEVSNRKYRFRILNGSNRRDYRLQLSNGDTLFQIGTDGGLLDAPLALGQIFMTPAYRVDVVIDFSTVGVGNSVILQNDLGLGTTSEIMRFDVTSSETDTSSLPGALVPITPLLEVDADVTRSFTFGKTGPVFTINGLAYNPAVTNFTVNLGDTEIWELTNNTGLNHPVHIHDIMWQVLDVDGLPPGDEYKGWKDTFHLPGFTTVRVIGKFTDYTGLYVMHCHNLEHEDNAMMLNFEVVP